ncbi:hypothetical protein GGE65_005805 [Skermanella aerolata]|uniref:Ferredoxin n=1 Tax=Skermanella aerolata TaxID=393310 RepID=A0A512DZI8_9PROT|nr:four-helix bundle copper-binding protein [Skermanella aerolata]KJB91998.1 ferredoxin [Skermanella aerolata KACC 11604]GEO41903.1 ferredoxin [Skermanella aerolata]
MAVSMDECIRNCTECHTICMKTVTHCLGVGGKHADQGHIRMLLDCAQICATSADFMTRGSPLHRLTCGACAEICQQCANDCERMAGGDQQMLQCVEMCRRCSASCRDMAA